MIEENNLNTERMSSCTSFISCNEPRCPLDEYRSERKRYGGENKCVAVKRTRLNLGVDLPLKGLTPQEYEGIMSFYPDLKTYIKHKIRL